MLAAIDIGSNSVKYLFANSERGALVPVEVDSWVTRLGKALERGGGQFDEKSLASTETAFHEIAARLKQRKRQLKHIEIVATAAARNAKNPEALEKMVERILGQKLRIISGLEEAEFSMRGAAQAAKQHFPNSLFVFMDVGGASTEVGFLKPKLKAHSFQGGALKCHEGLGLDKIPVSDEQWNDAKIEILNYFPNSYFEKLLSQYDPKKYKAIAVGGTLLQAVDLCEAIFKTSEGSLVSKEALDELANQVRSKSIRDRRAMTGMDIDRADILPAGIIVLTSCLTRLAQEEVFVTPWGLRHGLLAQHL
ncbi:hypothetical protein GW916_08010 [bacterium]|nr:hypothetical protein [bacterium]